MFPLSSFPQTIFATRSSVESRVIDTGAVLVDMRSGAAFELNRIGAEIWELLRAGATEAAICDTLAAKYKVDRSVLESDVKQLVNSMLCAGLIQTERPNAREPEPK